MKWNGNKQKKNPRMITKTKKKKQSLNKKEKISNCEDPYTYTAVISMDSSFGF